MSNIEKELSKSKKEVFENYETSKSLDEVKLLLDSAAQEDAMIFRALGKNNSIVVSEEKIGRVREIERLDEKYNGGVYTLDQIKKLAIKYNLRFLPSEYYIGKIDIQVAAKIREFSKECGISLHPGTIGSMYHILAPVENFDTKKIRERRFWFVEDPAIFYKIDYNHYRLIHKWGSDFTILRRIKGLMSSSGTIQLWMRTLLTFPIVLGLLAVLYYFIPDNTRWHEGMAVFSKNSLLVSFCTSFIISFVRGAKHMNDPFLYKKSHYNKRTWNTNDIYI